MSGPGAREFGSSPFHLLVFLGGGTSFCLLVTAGR